MANSRRLTQILVNPLLRRRASLIKILLSVRSERQLVELMQLNLLFRCFVGLGIDDPVWVLAVFAKNRDRLPSMEMSRQVMSATSALAR